MFGKVLFYLPWPPPQINHGPHQNQTHHKRNAKKLDIIILPFHGEWLLFFHGRFFSQSKWIWDILKREQKPVFVGLPLSYLPLLYVLCRGSSLFLYTYFFAFLYVICLLLPPQCLLLLMLNNKVWERERKREKENLFCKANGAGAAIGIVKVNQ